MGARYVALSVLVWAGLSVGNEGAHAQSAPGGVQALPPIVVSRTAPNVKPARARTAARAIRPPPKLVVYPTTPASSSGIDIEKVPASVNVIDVTQIDRVPPRTLPTPRGTKSP